MSEQIGVVGGGRMGAGIAFLFASNDIEVVVVEADLASAKDATSRIETIATQALARGTSEESLETILSRVKLVTSLQELPIAAGIVIEAIQEDSAAKKQVLASVEAAVSEECLIASNTSSISISALANALNFPGRFLGMHFFNPVHSSLLVEVVVGKKTSNDTVTQAVNLVKDLGKTEIVVRDSPGFATSRLGVLLGIEAIRMVEEGVAAAEEIDRAMELGYKHAMGPLRSTDLVGLDVRLAIAEQLTRELGERFSPPQLLRDKVERGQLGRKTGEGFYVWDK
jgi:3-hydroxybutyryl-CoA dehydrogenase